jgi:uncharacterized protein (DUF1015 family)
VPILRPFRALRFDAASTDLSAVLTPPYDIISPEQRRDLLERDPYNAVRLELPADLGSADDESYRGAAGTLAAWRTDHVLVKDRVPCVTVHQMRWADAAGREQQATGFLCRLRLESFGPDAGVLPHERTLSGPKEDRYRLLRATGLNTSPIVLLAGSDRSATAAELEALTQPPPDAEATTADGVRHRVWIVPTPDPGLLDLLDDAVAVHSADGAGPLLAAVSQAPLTIADGHHRYETALRYRAERGARRACESDPAWDYVLALVYPLDQAPPALPTHRVLRGEPDGLALLERLRSLGSVEALADRAALLAAMAQAPVHAQNNGTGSGRLGLLSGGKAAIVRLDRVAIEAMLPAGLSAASRGLDVNALSVVIERLYGTDAATLAGDGRLWYVKDATEATAQVAAGAASTCFLLDGMPGSAIAAVARAGEVMPQKSTYFHPKAPAGLAFSPMEW